MEHLSRSQKYQAFYKEGTYNDNQWKTIETLSNYEQVQIFLLAFAERSISEDYILQLEAQLEAEMWAIIMTQGTPRQIEVAQLILAGKTQTEIANLLGIKQPDVYKVLRGNMDYQAHAMYGGLRNKLTKAIKLSATIKDIMKQIDNADTNVDTPHFFCFKRIFASSIDYYNWLNQETIHENN
jgi:predicted transcriptional regulator